MFDILITEPCADYDEMLDGYIYKFKVKYNVYVCANDKSVVKQEKQYISIKTFEILHKIIQPNRLIRNEWLSEFDYVDTETDIFYKAVRGYFVPNPREFEDHSK